MSVTRMIAGVLAALVLSAAAYAEKPEIYTGMFNNLAVGGYDPVAYFEEGAPVKGSDEFSTDWMGAEWRFSSQDNLDQFLADPEAYAPQYGGYCAWAVAQDKTARGDPDYWRIVDGKLYLNYSKKIQSDWEKDIPGFIVKADENWPKVIE